MNYTLWKTELIRLRLSNSPLNTECYPEINHTFTFPDVQDLCCSFMTMSSICVLVRTVGAISASVIIKKYNNKM